MKKPGSPGFFYANIYVPIRLIAWPDRDRAGLAFIFANFKYLY